MVVNYIYDEKFDGNVLVVNQTDCRKTTFIQNLTTMKMVNDTKNVFWLTKFVFLREKTKYTLLF